MLKIDTLQYNLTVCQSRLDFLFSTHMKDNIELRMSSYSTNKEFKLITEEELQSLTIEQKDFLEEHNFLAPELIIKKCGNLLRIRTPNETWKCLCGREWQVNLDTLESQLICMN